MFEDSWCHEPLPAQWAHWGNDEAYLLGALSGWPASGQLVTVLPVSNWLRSNLVQSPFSYRRLSRARQLALSVVHSHSPKYNLRSHGSVDGHYPGIVSSKFRLLVYFFSALQSKFPPVDASIDFSTYRLVLLATRLWQLRSFTAR